MNIILDLTDEQTRLIKMIDDCRLRYMESHIKAPEVVVVSPDFLAAMGMKFWQHNEIMGMRLLYNHKLKNQITCYTI